MTTLSRIENYIAKEDLSNVRYEMNCEEATALRELISCGGVVLAISMAFDYGRAKGLREARAGIKA